VLNQLCKDLKSSQEFQEDIAYDMIMDLYKQRNLNSVKNFLN